MSTEKFYSNLPTSSDFLDITNCQKLFPAPLDWYIIITDIVGSTTAIENGRYKEVNLIGVCSIAAILDLTEDIEIPFIFGGDGASLLIPPSLVNPAKQVLRATQILAKEQFKLNLRVGFVPVEIVTQANYQVKVGKIKVFGKYNQGVFAGGGINYATDLVKNTSLYTLESSQDLPPTILFNRVACPWQDIRSEHGEIMSLIITAIVPEEQQKYQVYKEVLQEIERIYGNANHYHPITANHLKLTFNPHKLALNLKIHGRMDNGFTEKFALLKMQIQIFLAWLWLEVRLKVVNLGWEDSKQDFVAATDYRKFSDTLNMVISGHPTQREKLIKFLEKKYGEQKLIYGLHVSDYALMTCYTRDPHNHHVHFVDGADGGYALAAKVMKEKMALLNR